MSPQEINEAVARKLGWGIYEGASGMTGTPHVTDGKFVKPLSDYSTSIQAAWEIVESATSFIIRKDHRTGIFECYLSNGKNVQIEEADTAPMAICLAFLKLP